MMMNYTAFKSLRMTNDGVYSPQRNTKSDEIYVLSLGRLTYNLSAASLEGKQGVYAATFGEVSRYMEEYSRMFLVTPVPDAETEVGTKGWRTTCAPVIGKVHSLHDVAGLMPATRPAIPGSGKSCAGRVR